MAASVFEWVCQELQATTALDRLATRGTVRLALKSNGLVPAQLTTQQLEVILERVLPGELAARGVPEADPLCRKIRGRLARAGLESGAGSESPEAIFARLGARD